MQPSSYYLILLRGLGNLGLQVPQGREQLLHPLHPAKISSSALFSHKSAAGKVLQLPKGRMEVRRRTAGAGAGAAYAPDLPLAQGDGSGKKKGPAEARSYRTDAIIVGVLAVVGLYSRLWEIEDPKGQVRQQDSVPFPSPRSPCPCALPPFGIVSSDVFNLSFCAAMVGSWRRARQWPAFVGHHPIPRCHFAIPISQKPPLHHVAGRSPAHTLAHRPGVSPFPHDPHSPGV